MLRGCEGGGFATCYFFTRAIYEDVSREANASIREVGRDELVNVSVLFHDDGPRLFE